MHIVMTRTEFGSPDGIKIIRFVEGQVYDVDTWPMSRELARSFVQAKVADIVKEQPVPSPTENKDDTGFVAGRTKKHTETTAESETSTPTSEPSADTHPAKKSHKN